MSFTTNNISAAYSSLTIVIPSAEDRKADYPASPHNAATAAQPTGSLINTEGYLPATLLSPPAVAWTSSPLKRRKVAFWDGASSNAALPPRRNVFSPQMRDAPPNSPMSAQISPATAGMCSVPVNTPVTSELSGSSESPESAHTPVTPMSPAVHVPVNTPVTPMSPVSPAVHVPVNTPVTPMSPRTPVSANTPMSPQTPPAHRVTPLDSPCSLPSFSFITSQY